MKELDLLKRLAKNKDSFDQISEIEIYKMIQKIVFHCEVVLIISILEVMLWTCLSLIF
jgi:hypothetical protein